jgi:DNA-binding CsgD family transcriptional regulator
MTTPAAGAFWALTEKEKQTLHLIVRGHDAKSTARSLGLSVHTINERLRDARRKMGVSSSREARKLLEAEGGDVASPYPDLSGDAKIGEDVTNARFDQERTPRRGVGRGNRPSWIIIGVLLMTLAFGLLALTALPQLASTPAPQPIVAHATTNAEAVDTARIWLALLDQARWDESYQATRTSFRKLNTAQAWAAASEKVRVPLGKVLSRAFISQENLPAPPFGYEVVKFRTSFTNQAETVETVTLEREDGSWRVVGVTIG